MGSRSGFLDGPSPGAANTNTTQRSESAVRSRTRRLISFNDEEELTNGASSPSALSSSFAPERQQPARSRGATPSPYTSRGVSPLPMSHPSRATESLSRGRQNGGGTTLGGFGYDGQDQFGVAESSRAAVDFLDSSWSSLQSLASSVLGSDIARPASNGSPRSHARKSSRPDPFIGGTSRAPTPSAWGPSAPSTPEIGAGTKEDRQAYVQAKKREALLLADTGPSTSRNTLHKRRISGENHAAIAPDEDDDALVYIHHVQPTDTMTGLTIKYGCQPAIFRKANGFWPSDSIQSRKTVLLPVESCSVKGRPIRPTTDTDLLDNDSSEDLNGSSIAPAPVLPDRTDQKEAISLNTSCEAEGDRVWKPESWVLIDNFPTPVEIGRVPRRALGFFPRTRRKSLSFSDADSPSTSFQGTATTTASSSASSLHDSPSSQSTTLPSGRPHAGSSESTKPYKPGIRHQRQRSNIQLAGPGVGNLDRSTKAPGPALDGLSKFLTQHMPTLAPPPPPAMNPDSGAFESTSTAQSNASTGLDNIGGAFEGWVRKMTSRAKSSLSELQQGTPGYQANGRVHTRSGNDLIELDDGLEARNTPCLPGESRRKPEPSRSEPNATTSLGGDRAGMSGTSRTRATTGDDPADRMKGD